MTSASSLGTWDESHPDLWTCVDVGGAAILANAQGLEAPDAATASSTTVPLGCPQRSLARALVQPWMGCVRKATVLLPTSCPW